VFKNLKPGDYQVYVELDVGQNVVLSSYSKASIVFRGEEHIDRLDFLQRTLTSRLELNAEKQSYSKYGIPEAYKLECKFESGFAGILYRNDSLEATIEENVVFTKLEGAKLLAPFDGQAKCQISLAPQT
jgi:hypothetical protein